MERPTRGAAIVFQLTREILSGALAPGTTLEEIALAERLGASRTPVREALRQLAASGLVELRPHRPARVVAIDVDGLAEMFEAMAELEALCAARAARLMTPALRRRLEAQHEAMAALVRGVDLPGYRAENLSFHTLIYDGAANRYLKDLALATRERLAPHRGVQLDSAERLARSHAEHETVMRAILRGDADGAAAAMRAHLEATRNEVVRIGAPSDLPFP
ncbi:GntR family transcriptional regulator [Salinarimonas ramus]|uniref:Transcriptional regulator n=1 Tax=Salinarimonas ramus TaxID=690164 RepID=A0A917QDS6_9HYPH|nr:GntR family transcriptional regulator [Salinarimonas ramus]GGK45520.1 transcriptional regulator [Salinarimonas ramus]